MGFNQLLDDISDGHHHQLSSAQVTWEHRQSSVWQFKCIHVQFKQKAENQLQQTQLMWLCSNSPTNNVNDWLRLGFNVFPCHKRLSHLAIKNRKQSYVTEALQDGGKADLWLALATSYSQFHEFRELVQDIELFVTHSLFFFGFPISSSRRKVRLQADSCWFTGPTPT